MPPPDATAPPTGTAEAAAGARTRGGAGPRPATSDPAGGSRRAGRPGGVTRTAADGRSRRRLRCPSRATVLALGAGLLIAASLPPWGWWPLAFGGIALLDHGLAGASRRDRFRRGTAAGLALFAPTIVWISQLTAPGYVIAVLVYAAITGGLCVLVPPGAGRRPALVGAWVLAESLRSAWPFGGVPLSLLGVGQVGGPLAPIARVGGVLAIGLATAAVGVALSAALARRPRIAAVGAVGALGLVGLAQVAPSGSDTGRAIDVAFVQGGGPQGTRAINTDRRKVFERHLAASREVPEGMDLVLWPENVVDTDFDVQDALEGRELQELARELDAPLIVGTVEGVSDTAFRNSSQVLNADGEWTDRFVKVQRVPFGEWVPFRSLIERVAPDTLARRDATVSTQSGLLRAEVELDTAQASDATTGSVPLATVISWEVFFGHRARAGVQAGGEVLYNPTNGSTYTGTFVQTQQVAHSRLRAIETGRWLVQVAPTGFSAYVTPDGEVLQRTGTRERAVRVHRDLPLRTGETWYVRWGDLPARLAALALVAAGWALALRSDRSQRDPSVPSPAGTPAAAASP